MLSCRGLLIFGCLHLLATVAHAASLDARVVWLEGKPNIAIAVDKLPALNGAEATPPLEVPLTLFDSQNNRLWQTVLKVPTSGNKAGTLTAPLEKIVDVKKQHRLEITARNTALAIDLTMRITFGIESATVPWFGIASDETWPKRKIFFLLPLPGFKGQTREVPVAITVRDGDDAVAFQREMRLAPSDSPQLHRLDVTPDTTASIGPYTVDIDVDSESHGLSFRTTEKFAQPNAQIPLSGFESGDRGLWFAADGQPQRYQTGQMYYSEHLRDLQPRDYPAVTYDAAEKHGGRQALKVAYESGREAYVWSRQVLPGKPLAMSVWVKGNETDDQLVAFYEDHINFTLPAWQRNGNFENHVVCSLNFAGWREFLVPVLGGGLQVSGNKGSTLEVDGPVKILALVVKTAKPKGKEKEPAEPRQIWIDDLSVQTQVAPPARLSLETQLNRADGVLATDTTLAISVGNGQGAKLSKGKLTLTARDADGQSSWTRTVDLAAEDRGFTTVALPLADLAATLSRPVAPPTGERVDGATRLRGPVDLDVTFADASIAGARITKRVTLKRPLHSGIAFDFERQETYSGFQPGKVTASHSQVVAGGAENSAKSLSLTVLPKQEDNSVLLHPALPGKLDRVELMIHGSGKPTLLQPWFIDAGATGIWLRNYNLFWADPITVDWSGWKKVTIATPPVPAYHNEKNRTFLFEPTYPLNLAFNAKLLDAEATEPAEVRLDNVRVITHLAEADVLPLEIEYPDESRLHQPGAPLTAVLTNFSPDAVQLDLQFTLHQYQGFVAKQGKQSLTIAAGQRQRVTLVDQLPPGVFDIDLSYTVPATARKAKVRLPVMALVEKNVGQASSLSSERQAGSLSDDSLSLRRSLGLFTERLYLDWDNIEPAPHLRHFFWFEQETKKRREVPVLLGQAKDLAEKQQAAAAEVAKVEQALKTAQGQLVQAQQAAKQAAQKVATSIKNLEPLQAALEPAQKALADAQKKSDAAAAEQTTAQTAQADAMKVADTAANELKIEMAKLAPATKAVAEAEKKKEDATVAKAALDALQKKLAALPATVKAAQDVAAAAKKTLDEKQKAATQLKQELTKSQQAFQQAEKKLQDSQKVLEGDRATLAAKEQARRDVDTGIDVSAKAIADARTALAVATEKFEMAKKPLEVRLEPVVGFSADWAGAEAREPIAKGNYVRWIPNMLQAPDKLIDWSLFVREIQREYKGRFDRWVFWENPDLDQAPQTLAPERYRPLLEVFHRWVKLYSPQAKVIAGGFNFDKALDYFARIPNAHTLPFDEIAVQMNIGELSPEQADMEGFLDELNTTLKLRETGRTATITELDWGISEYTSALQQAAYHVRAAMILHSRGASPHQFSLVNTGFELPGYGVFYRLPFGNSAELQTFKPAYVPKPAYFALIETNKFLTDWKFDSAASLPGRSLDDQRAFLYRNSAGQLAAAMWRTQDGDRTYRWPTAWKDARVADSFGVAASTQTGLRITALPLFVFLPNGSTIEQLRHELRHLEATDSSHAVLFDLHLSEADSVQRAKYQSTGSPKLKPIEHAGVLPGGSKLREMFLSGLEREEFSFNASQAGNVLLRRRWHFDGQGESLFVKLNDGPELPWKLGAGQDNAPGVREGTLVLTNARAGENRVALRYEKPGTASGYRIEPLTGDFVPLVRWGAINTRQTKGRTLNFTNATGGGLSIGKTSYGDGIGAHATSFIEFPLAKQFDRFEVTVGIDAGTEGRGSVVFRIYVDGQPRADSGVINGFNPAKTLTVDKLSGAERLILSVTDAGDGDRHDLANWVDGKLFLKSAVK